MPRQKTYIEQRVDLYKDVTHRGKADCLKCWSDARERYDKRVLVFRV